MCDEARRPTSLLWLQYFFSFALQMAKVAKSVLAVDSSEHALTEVRQGAEHNALANVQTVRGDAFAILRELHKKGEKFDCIVVDPPAFAKSSAHVNKALAGYREVNQMVGIIVPCTLC